jgi:hypothetical protein
VIDGRLITSWKPDDLPAVNRTMLGVLAAGMAFSFGSELPRQANGSWRTGLLRLVGSARVIKILQVVYWQNISPLASPCPKRMWAFPSC